MSAARICAAIRRQLVAMSCSVRTSLEMNRVEWEAVVWEELVVLVLTVAVVGERSRVSPA